MWKFKYIRADRVEVETGPYATEEEAQEERDKMASFSAICSEPFEVPGETPQRKGSYVDQKVSELEIYFQKELAILEQKGITINIAYDFLRTSIRRIEMFIKENAPFIPKGNTIKNFSSEDIKKFKKERDGYLARVIKIIESKANYYDPLDGSYWESVGERLRELAKKIANKKTTEIGTKV